MHVIPLDFVVFIYQTSFVGAVLFNGSTVFMTAKPFNFTYCWAYAIPTLEFLFIFIGHPLFAIYHFIGRRINSIARVMMYTSSKYLCVSNLTPFAFSKTSIDFSFSCQVEFNGALFMLLGFRIVIACQPHDFDIKRKKPLNLSNANFCLYKEKS